MVIWGAPQHRTPERLPLRKGFPGSLQGQEQVGATGLVAEREGRKDCMLRLTNWWRQNVSCLQKMGESRALD